MALILCFYRAISDGGFGGDFMHIMAVSRLRRHVFNGFEDAEFSEL